ncbi:sigma 54-interacting transcriptional regulator [Clostridium uliginosum]|uniref:Transcriptional regulator containing an AAA-type ATPase domain and a DNA-binding domain n=1 Tax=Clostridium uliginosum TaxID=119641 RepID=A0A1I1N8F5_9CLOT|nr:sigma 54-interacting transcriptional regulator [Clostridium uliginosum]SFC93909.1 Transcriptional regulator containing an AAA-type ATPase domain and a DNA-binding domain [Clostridium uliginosum]
MKRIKLIYDTIKKLDNATGITTKKISDYLNLERSNVSKDLNLLVKDNLLYKNNSRPVKYFLNNPNNLDISTNSSMDQLSYFYPSLTHALKLSKTAILYPPNGMNCLIIGDTGVGKSMLASLMHEYASSLNTTKDIPFLHFNCSDYSNNVQLLSSHLFGVKKGTFTGATKDKSGLIEQADGGILFLDEIHNLPSEGQEMLFIFMDTGYFKRFGEVSHKIKSSARIICATNKDINTSLLDTFIRRIPIKIYLPSLNERSLEERLVLIESFLKQESQKLNKPILISYNSILCFLSYDCPYNIGQLKNDITLAVANAYSDYLINNKKQVKINSLDLPDNLQSKLSQPLLSEKNLLNCLNNLNGYFIYDNNTKITNHSFLKYKQSILNSFKDLITNINNSLKNKHLNNSTLVDSFNDYLITIKNNIPNYHYNLNNSAYESLYENLININERTKTFFTDDILNNFFHIHIDLIYERINLININCTPIINKLKKLYPDYYSLTLKFKYNIEEIYNVNLSDIEILFLIVLVAYISN